MAKYDFNMVAIGAGAAGLVTSYICAATQGKVALIEKHKMGGDCLNTGCVPSKALIRTAKFMNDIKNAQKLGIQEAHATLDFKQVMDRVQRVIQTIEPHDSVERYQSLGVDCFIGEAKILSPHHVEVNGQTLTTKNITIATGARPLIPNIPGLKDVNPLTSDNLWQLREAPKHLVILGGGPIGSELAQAFSRLGVKVTQVEMADRLLQKEDSDVSQIVLEKFQKEGIEVLLQHRLVSARKEGSQIHLECEAPEGPRTINCDQVLVALGRQANTRGFGLEELGVETHPNGTVKVDPYLRTLKYKNIYACGDVAGPYQFTHVAAHQAWFCSVNSMVLPFWGFKANYDVIPWATYTDPEVARVGINEQEAKEKNIPYQLTTYELKGLDRAVTDEAAYGLVKVLTPPKKDKILGVTIVGLHAGDIMAEYVLAMKHGLGLNKILGTIHIYPTLAEANKYAAGNWKKSQVSPATLKWGERLNRWRR